MNVSVSSFMPSRRSPAIISRRVDSFHPAHICMFKAAQQNVKVIEGTMAPPALPAPTELGAGSAATENLSTSGQAPSTAVPTRAKLCASNAPT
jgi:hypothetical protein